MKSIYLTVPNADGWVHKLVHFAIIRMMQDQRFIIRHDAPTHQPYEQNLHKCLWDFLNGGEQYWISIDSDNPPVRNPLDLIELDCDIIGLPTPVWYNAVPGDQPYYFNALKWVEDKQGYQPIIGEGLTEVDAVGSGCFIIARRVIEALKDEQPFVRQWGQDGLVQLGCDFSFCKKAKEKGFRVFTHFDFICHHINDINLLEVIQALGAMNERRTN